MAFDITYKKSVQRDLKKLSKADAKKLLNKLEKDLTKNADAYPPLKGEFAGLRKFRVGDYRVIFALIDNNVLILRIQHRKDVYRKRI